MYAKHKRSRDHSSVVINHDCWFYRSLIAIIIKYIDFTYIQFKYRPNLYLLFIPLNARFNQAIQFALGGRDSTRGDADWSLYLIGMSNFRGMPRPSLPTRPPRELTRLPRPLFEMGYEVCCETVTTPSPLLDLPRFDCNLPRGGSEVGLT